jgi:hypothetical protein
MIITKYSSNVNRKFVDEITSILFKSIIILINFIYIYIYFAWTHIRKEKLLSCNFTTNDVSINNVNLDKMLNPNLGYKKLECIRIDVFFQIVKVIWVATSKNMWR